MKVYLFLSFSFNNTINVFVNILIVFNGLYTTANDASAPINVTASPLSEQVGIRVSWTEPTLPTGLPITGYSIQYKIRGMSDSPYEIVTVLVEASTNDITGLQNSTQYRIRVATITGLGTGPYCCGSGEQVFVTTSE